MNVQYNRHWSDNLGRYMEYKVYGTEGKGVLVFPSQDQRFYEWEDNGMIDVLAPMIEAGQIHIICNQLTIYAVMILYSANSRRIVHTGPVSCFI